ncbi:hypothetical protein N801_09880 [Knoellia aerolata DSM 18566]|uniref:Tyr recombinase domain-containing protein n=1 Tax=Knoellia aerolata DSM 18566 TaxID=1385519 RepID=A0A0A0JY52_9MICO|nr:hypothetical protein N801_09880 [Knoellia aerolata DSM 18566]
MSLWTVDLPAGHAGLCELAWSAIWVVGALLLAFVVVAGGGTGRNARRAWGHGWVAQLLTGLRMGWRDWIRTPVLWVLLVAVPAVFILLADAVTPHGQTPVVLREDGVSRVNLVDPALMHAGTMAPIAVASLASLVGVFMVLDSRAADRRLLLAGERRAALIASRLVLVFVATGVATAVSLAVTATVFQPRQWGVYAAGKWRALTLVSGWCGLRIGEAAGLRRVDVDLEAGVLRVSQTAQYLGTPARLVIGPPKSDRGVRTVHMPLHVTEALSDHITRRAHMQARDFVWTRKDGGRSRATRFSSPSSPRLPRLATKGWCGTTSGTPQTRWQPTPALARRPFKRAWATLIPRSVPSTFTRP